MPGRFIQPKDGNRFGLEAVALAYFPALSSGLRVMDLGTGTGIIPVILAHRLSTLEIVGFEVQPFLTGLALQNISLSEFSDIITIVNQDIRKIKGQEPLAFSFDLVLANPPFFKANSGCVSALESQNIASLESGAELKHWFEAAGFLLKPGGRFCLVLPATRFLEALSLAGGFNLKPSRLSWVSKNEKSPGKYFLLEFSSRETLCPLAVLPNIFP